MAKVESGSRNEYNAAAGIFETVEAFPVALEEEVVCAVLSVIFVVGGTRHCVFIPKFEQDRHKIRYGIVKRSGVTSQGEYGSPDGVPRGTAVLTIGEGTDCGLSGGYATLRHANRGQNT